MRASEAMVAEAPAMAALAEWQKHDQYPCLLPKEKVEIRTCRKDLAPLPIPTDEFLYCLICTEMHRMSRASTKDDGADTPP
jgi:hypothetical protein